MHTGRALMGITFVVLGVLFLLDQQGLLDAGAVIGDFWPVLLVVWAALELLSRPPRRISAGILGVLGIILLGITTGLFGGDVFAVVWSLAIIALGLWLLLRRPGAGTGGGGGGESRDEMIDVVTIFSGRNVVNTAPQFRGGSVIAVFGGAEVDLTGATISDQVVLDAVAVFGGIEVRVPYGWRVAMVGPAIFGGHDNKVATPTDPDAPTLRVQATAIFGGVEVTSHSPSRPPVPPPAPTPT